MRGEKMLFKNIFWDFDGTLYDTYPHIHSAYLAALRDFGMTVDEGALMDRLKINFRAAHDYTGASPELIAKFKSYENDIAHQPTASYYAAIPSLIRETHAAGARHFLFTHRNELAKEYLRRDGLLEYFTDAVTSESADFELKPSPKGILAMIERNRLNPAECVMVGDREIDVASGKNASIEGILFDEFGKLGETAAKYRVYSIEELKKLLLS